uniref:Uncharacterized protein n=1 Tax=Timema tahoe TaxID=61484 RepID=A0A7R9IMJ1_9NEOP|nr:unnamed protein product [Timema tahoe]
MIYAKIEAKVVGLSGFISLKEQDPVALHDAARFRQEPTVSPTRLVRLTDGRPGLHSAHWTSLLSTVSRSVPKKLQPPHPEGWDDQAGSGRIPGEARINSSTGMTGTGDSCLLPTQGGARELFTSAHRSDLTIFTLSRVKTDKKNLDLLVNGSQVQCWDFNTDIPVNGSLRSVSPNGSMLMTRCSGRYLKRGEEVGGSTERVSGGVVLTVMTAPVHWL